MLKIKNMAYVPASKTFLDANKAAIATWMGSAANINKPYVTAAEIRAAFPDWAAKLTDGIIAEMAKSLGIESIND